MLERDIHLSFPHSLGLQFVKLPAVSFAEEATSESSCCEVICNNMKQREYEVLCRCWDSIRRKDAVGGASGIGGIFHA